MMNDLLDAIQAHLESLDLAESVFLMDFLSDEEDLLPRHVKLPGIGIKDGQEDEPKDLTNSLEQRSLQVFLAVYVSRSQREGAALRQALDLAESVRSALKNNLLGLAGVIQADFVGSDDSRPIRFPGKPAVRKVLAFSYQLED